MNITGSMVTIRSQDMVGSLHFDRVFNGRASFGHLLSTACAFSLPATLSLSLLESTSEGDSDLSDGREGLL